MSNSTFELDKLIDIKLSFVFLKMNKETVSQLLSSFELEPTNFNFIVQLIKHARESSKPRLAYILGKGILSIVSLSSGITIDLTSLYYELSVSCFYMNKIHEGSMISDRLIYDRNVPSHLKQTVHSNLTWYLERLDWDSCFPVPVNAPMMFEDGSSGERWNSGFQTPNSGVQGNPKDSLERWRPLNPGIFRLQDKLIINCRCVNYNQVGTSYTSCHLDGKIRTRNFLIECDTNFNPIKQIEVVDQFKNGNFPKWIEGHEDCRFVPSGDGKELLFSAVTFHLTLEYLPQIAVSKISTEKVFEAFKEMGETKVPIESTQLIRGPNPGRCEKNWLPFVREGELHFVYLYDPFVIIKPTSSSIEVVEVEPSKFDFSRFRGSAAPIEFDDGYLLIVHEVIFNSKGERTYVHRFLWFNNDLTLSGLKVSPVWYLKEPGIEFCSGMLMMDRTIYIGAGLKDKEAWIFKIGVEKVREMLKEVE